MVRVFVRLKLALLRSAFVSSPLSAVVYAFAAAVAVAGGLLMAALLAVILGQPTRFGGLLPMIVLTTVWLMWVMGPLLNTAQGDQTIDPIRLEPLPLTDSQRVTGLFAAGLIGPPAVATLVGGLGAAAARGFSPPARVGVILVAVLFVVLCLAWSRAMAALFRGLLDTRRGRDLMVLLTGGLAVVVLATSERFNDDPQTIMKAEPSGAGDLVLLFPPAALGRSLIALRDGEWWFAAACIGWTVLAIVAAFFVWLFALRRMRAGAVHAGRRSGLEPTELFPIWLRWLPRNALTATAAKEARYLLLRNGQQVQQLLLGTILALLVVLQTVFRQDTGPWGSYLGAFVVFLVMWQGSTNVFGADNTAASGYLLSGVPMRTVLAGKLLGLLLVALPLAVIIQLAVSGFRAEWEAIGVGLVAIGVPALVWVGLGAQLSVRVPFPLKPGVKVNTATLVTAMIGGLVGAGVVTGAIVGAAIGATTLAGTAWAGVAVAWPLAAMVAVGGFSGAATALERAPDRQLAKLSER